jgi:H+/gluconate symporter-like permease
MAENLSKGGLTFKRSDRNWMAKGTLMRLRGGAIARGELVRIDTTSSDDQINTDTETIDFGTESGSSSVFASVIKVAAAVEGEIVGVALHAADENEMVRVEFAEDGAPVMVYALFGDTVTIGLQLAAATDARLDPIGTPVGKILAIALEGGSNGDLKRVLFYGNAGTGFNQT